MIVPCIYLMKREDGLRKVGSTRNVEVRLWHLNRGRLKYVLEKTWETDNVWKLKRERIIHQQLDGYRYQCDRSDLYDIDLEPAVAIIKLGLIISDRRYHPVLLGANI
jgi:hypothetical protein